MRINFVANDRKSAGQIRAKNKEVLCIARLSEGGLCRIEGTYIMCSEEVMTKTVECIINGIIAGGCPRSCIDDILQYAQDKKSETETVGKT